MFKTEVSLVSIKEYQLDIDRYVVLSPRWEAYVEGGGVRVNKRKNYTLKCSAFENALWQVRQANFFVVDEGVSDIATARVSMWEMKKDGCDVCCSGRAIEEDLRTSPVC